MRDKKHPRKVLVVDHKIGRMKSLEMKKKLTQIPKSQIICSAVKIISLKIIKI